MSFIHNIKKIIWQSKNDLMSLYHARFVGSTRKIGSDIAIISTFSSIISHNMAATLLSEELQKAGCKVRQIDISVIVNAPIGDDNTEYDKSISDVDTIIFAINPDNMVHIINKLGSNILEGRFIIGYWVWELEKPPLKWKSCDKLVHEIWTPSSFSANSLKKIFDKPIRIVPHAVAIRSPFKADADTCQKLKKHFKIEEVDFCVIQSFAVNSSMERKNVIASINAFLLAFGTNSRNRLIIRYFPSQEFPDALQRLKKAIPKSAKNIVLMQSNGKVNEMLNLYQVADAYISLHRAEGFGLNLAEAMLFGVPVIATKWSGNLDFMDDMNSCLIPCEMISIRDPDNIYSSHHGKWAQPNIEAAANALLRLKNDRDFAKNIISNARISVSNKLSGKNYFGLFT